MEIAEVVDEERLKAYLDGLPSDIRLLTMQRVACFSAINVAPVALRYFAENKGQNKGDLTPLSIFGGLSIAGLAATMPNPVIARAARAAAGAAAYATYAAGAAAGAADAARAAAYAARAAAGAAADAAYAAAYAADAAADAAIFWGDLRTFLHVIAVAPSAPLPILTLDADMADHWTATKAALRADTASRWDFWIIWFDRIVAGQNTHHDLIAPIVNDLNEEDWKTSEPARVNALFDGVLAVYQADNAEPSQPDAAGAAYFDFIEINREMRAVAFSSDYEAFPDDEAKSAFLVAAHDIRLVFEDWCALARAQLQGSNRPVTAVIATEQILDQLSALERGEAVSLRNLVRLGSNVKRLARDKELPVDLGDSVFEMFDEALEDYGQLVSVHLGGALQALMALRSLELGDLDSAECLDSLRGGLSYIQTLPSDVLLPFDAKSRAIIDHMVSDLEDEQSEIAEAGTEVARQTRAKRFAEKFGGVSATIREYLLKGQMAAEKGGESVDKAGKWHKRWQTLEKIKEFWDNLPFGDGL